MPRGVENDVAIDMIVKHLQRKLVEKSNRHREGLLRLGKQVEDEPLAANVLLLDRTRQIAGIDTILRNSLTSAEDFIFYFDRLATLLVER